MKAITMILIVLAVAGLVVFLLSRGGGDEAAKRVLYFGYYGTKGPQVQETADHTNLLWEAFWDGDDLAAANLIAANKFGVIDVGRIFDRQGSKNAVLSPNAENRLRALFDLLKAAGALSLVRMIIPHDEPNLPENQIDAELPGAVSLIRRVAAGYPELSSVLLGCIYYNHTPKSHTDLFDVVGFDDYEPGANILSPGGAYEKFRESLKPGQRTMLVPGGGWGPSRWEPKQQDPAPFVAYAQANAEVFAVIPFLWRYPPHGGAIVGICDLPVKDAYIAAGKRLIEGKA